MPYEGRVCVLKILCDTVQRKGPVFTAAAIIRSGVPSPVGLRQRGWNTAVLPPLCSTQSAPYYSTGIF